mmetsp:Transcript_24647/g.79334  ORF Transcript_24647/g.79334 Transcript_24647/m.79334 type:complete len:222 (+) Transcript_24647:1145-1810(+)
MRGSSSSTTSTPVAPVLPVGSGSGSATGSGSGSGSATPVAPVAPVGSESTTLPECSTVSMLCCSVSSDASSLPTCASMLSMALASVDTWEDAASTPPWESCMRCSCRWSASSSSSRRTCARVICDSEDAKLGIVARRLAAVSCRASRCSCVSLDVTACSDNAPCSSSHPMPSHRPAISSAFPGVLIGARERRRISMRTAVDGDAESAKSTKLTTSRRLIAR